MVEAVSLDEWLGDEAARLQREARSAWSWRKKHALHALAVEYSNRAYEAKLMRERLVMQETSFANRACEALVRMARERDNPSWKDMAL